jgi:hypothetical protein
MRVRCPDERNGCEKVQQELGAELRLSAVLGRYRSRVSRARQNRLLALRASEGPFATATLSSSR